VSGSSAGTAPGGNAGVASGGAGAGGVGAQGGTGALGGASVGGSSGSAGSGGLPSGGSAGVAGSAGASGGAAGSAGAAGGSAGAAGSAGSNAYPGTIIIQDNFDAAATVNTAKWEQYPVNSLAAIDTSRAHSAPNAMLPATASGVGSFLIPVSGQLGGMVATGNRFFVRVWVNFEKPTSMVGNHSTFLVGSVAKDNSGTELRLGMSSNQSGKPEMVDLNLQAPTDGGEVTRYSNGFTDGGNPGDFSGTGLQFAANQWYCIEALFDGAGSEFRLWVADAEVMEMHVHDFSGSGTGGRTTWGPMFKYLKIGTQDFSGQIGKVWYDDVFVGTAQIGCSR
jgi:hypothetical protein